MDTPTIDPGGSLIVVNSDDRASLVGGALVALAIVVLTLVSVSRIHVAPNSHPAAGFSPAKSLIDRQLLQGDGQAYAELARDPTLARPQWFNTGAPEAAYRAQRPLLGYLAWAGSAGQPGAVGWVLLLINLIAGAAVALAWSRLARLRGGPWWIGPLVLLAPGSVSALTWSTSEVLGLALVGWALWVWLTRPRTVAAPALLLASASLTRETFLLVPAALVVGLLVRGSARSQWQRTLGLLLSPVPWLAWVVVVRLRLGVWSFKASDGRLGTPLSGLVSAAQHWHVADWTCFALLVAATGFGLLRVATDMRWVVGFQVLLGLVMGEQVWARWQDFSRVLLPIYAIGLVGVAATTATSAGSTLRTPVVSPPIG